VRPIFAGRHTLFGRYLDLAPLGGRHRGLVVCPFHRDRTASLSIDLDRGLFHCFACNAEGGVRRFAELVGEGPPEVRPPGPPESEVEEARRRVLQEEHGRQARMAHWWPLLHAMAWLRVMERLIAWVRANASDSESGWIALEDAATLERFVDAKTTELEGLLARGRVA
jgi:hypothetical protein